MKQVFRIIISAFILVFFVSCGSEEKGLNDPKKIATTETKKESNNTTKTETIKDVQESNNTNKIEVGRKLFASNCVVCHGVDGVGLYKNWEVKVNGKYLAPPLNGTAHAPYHSRELLVKAIKEGSIKNGGNMPSFSHLSKENIENILDYLYDLWPEDKKILHDNLSNDSSKM